MSAIVCDDATKPETKQPSGNMCALVCEDPTKPPARPAADGFYWKYCTKPAGWRKQEDKDCWCGESWYASDTTNHEDGDHGGVWLQVRKRQPCQKKTRKSAKLASAKERVAKAKAALAKAKAALAKAKDALARAKNA
jgi:hypothetical protein